MAYGQNSTVPNFANAIGNSPAGRWRFSAINDMLLSIDHSGIDYNDTITDTMEGQHALRILTDVLYEVESKGWEYNTIDEFTATLDTDGKYTFGVTEGFPLGATYIFSVSGQDDKLFVDQNGVLRTRDLDLSTDGSVIGEPNEEVILDNVIIELWTGMQFALTQYVVALAVNRYQALMLGDSTKVSFSQQDIQQKYMDARRDEIRTGKYNMLTSTAGVEVRR